MRLIDADEFYGITSLLYAETTEAKIIKAQVLSDIRNMPTINAIVLPCEEGTTVWHIVRENIEVGGEIHECPPRVDPIVFTTDMINTYQKQWWLTYKEAVEYLYREKK